MRRGFSLAAAAASIILVVGTQLGCGGYNSSLFSTSSAAGLDQLAFVSVQNTSSGGIEVVDAKKDVITSTTVTLGGTSPALMIPGVNSTTLVFNAGNSGISVVDNLKQTLVAKIGSIDCTTSSCEIPLAGPTESMAESSDGKFIYAAIRTTSQVSVADLTGTTVKVTNIPATPGNCQATNNCLPGAHRLVLSHNNSKVLVFNEDLNQLEVIDTSNSSVKTVSGAGLDHPVYGVFSSDDTKAYILNCGPECGGTQASVAVLDTNALTIGQTVNVDAATIGASDTSNLYVAGSNPATPGAGSATILPLSSLTGARQIKIGDGFHQVISLFQNKVIVGARTCTTGCLSLVDPSAGSAVVDTPAAGQTQKGDVTALSPITTRAVFYAAEGGELRIYDVATGTEHLNNNTPVIDIVGKVTSVLYVGPKM